jgi:hypothetical protein
MDVLIDYRWLLDVARRQSLLLRRASTQLLSVVCVNGKRVVRDQNGVFVALEFGRGFIGDLENIAHIIRVCVPPAALKLNYNGKKSPCPVHGEWSVGDSGLAHQLLGPLEHASSEG